MRLRDFFSDMTLIEWLLVAATVLLLTGVGLRKVIELTEPEPPPYSVEWEWKG